ncbi:MAG: phosphoesterase [Candidatus Njordarchaeales archaeon]
MKKINGINKSILLIGDVHAPFEHCDYLAFCKAVHKKIQADIVINMGDWEDQHAISFHDSDCSLPSAGHELSLVIEKAKYWYKAFPKMKFLDSNHGSLVIRRMKHHGIPLEHIRPLKEVYNTPKWEWFEDILLKTRLGHIYLCHGKTSAYNKLAREIGCSAAQGHFHGKLEITWANSVFLQRFNLFVGCGINRASMAMAYGKNNIPQPMLGCAAIDREGIPHVYKMNIDKKTGRWDKKVN